MAEALCRHLRDLDDFGVNFADIVSHLLTDEIDDKRQQNQAEEAR